MKTRIVLVALSSTLAFATVWQEVGARTPSPGQTTVQVFNGEQFFVNGKPTYQGRKWRGFRIEGLLMNSRMVQGIFDDLNTQTAGRWSYPDTGKWDPQRNVNEFVAAMPVWRKHGLLAITVNFQGGSPEGYSKGQPWLNSAFEPDGAMRAAYQERMKEILDQADRLGMVVIVGYFYFGQDERLADEAAIIRAVDNATLWLLKGGWRNVLVEINNECDVSYDHAILKPARVHELVSRVKKQTYDNRHLLASVSYGGNHLPGEEIVKEADFILLHGNGVKDPKRIAEMVRQTRAIPGYKPKPIVFNEDDHFDFDKAENNFAAAISEYASWGYFDYRFKGEGYSEGYRSVPVNLGHQFGAKEGIFRSACRNHRSGEMMWPSNHALYRSSEGCASCHKSVRCGDRRSRDGRSPGRYRSRDGKHRGGHRCAGPLLRRHTGRLNR